MINKNCVIYMSKNQFFFILIYSGLKMNRFTYRLFQNLRFKSLPRFKLNNVSYVCLYPILSIYIYSL